MSMRGTRILLVFFAIFTSASMLIPSPMFPGSLVWSLLGGSMGGYYVLMGSVLNGVFYGLILWLAFVAISKRFGED